MLKNNLDYTSNEIRKISNKQRNIYGFLKNIQASPAAADAYLGALEALYDESRNDRIAQAAHSMREVLNILFPPEYKENIDTKLEKVKTLLDIMDTAQSDDKKSNRYYAKQILEEIKGTTGARIQAIATNLKQLERMEGIPEELILNIATEYRNSYSTLSDLAHHKLEMSDPELNEMLHEAISLLENYIYGLLTPFYDNAPKLKELMEKENLTDADVTQLIQLIQKPAHYKYFFTKCTNSEWVDHLADKGYFKYPLKRQYTDDGYFIPRWLESDYLNNIASISSDRVTKLLLEMEKTDNNGVHRDLLEVVLNLNSKDGIKVLTRIKKERWFYVKHHSRIPDVIGDIVVKWLNDGYAKEAMELFSATTWIEATQETFMEHPSTKLEAVIDSWEYQELIKKVNSVAIDKCLSEYLSSICKKLNYTIEAKKIKENEDLLHIARPTIGGNRYSRNTSNIQQVLINAVQVVIDDCVKNNDVAQPDAISKVLEIYEYPIFTRLRMYLYRHKPENFVDNIQELLCDQRHLEHRYYWPDYFELINHSFSLVDSTTQQTFLNSVDEGPKEGETAEYNNAWKTQVLLSLEDILPKEWRIKLEKLKETNRDIKKYTPHEFGTVRTGPNSPLGKEELAAMDEAETIKYLKKWQPTGTDFLGPSVEGLGRVLKETTKDDPKKAIPILKKGFEDQINPDYIYQLIAGLKDAEIDAPEVVIEIIDKIVSNKPYETANMEKDVWKSVQRAAADFIEETLKNKVLDLKYRSQVWNIIKKLANNPEPTLEFEEEYGGDNMDAGTLAINTIRGEALHAVIKYNSWVNSKENVETRLNEEVKEFLEEKLKTDKTQTTRSVYGQYLPYLYYTDKKWVKHNLRRIFSKDFRDRQTQAAWDSYLKYSNFWYEAALAIKNVYLDAIESEDLKHDKADYRIAEHVIILYLNGHINLEDELISTFYKHANEDTRAHASWMIWRYLREVEVEQDSDAWTRIKSLWKMRLESSNYKNKDRELGTFAEILEKAPEEIEGIFDLIMGSMPHIQKGIDLKCTIEYLEQNVAKSPKLCAMVLKEIVTEYPDDIRFSIYTENIRNILVSCISAGGDAKNIARDTMNIFGDKGDTTYIELYENTFLDNK